MPEKIRVGDFVRIEAKGLVVFGAVEYADGDGSLGDEYNLEVRNERNGKIHYWKQRFDGGSVDVIQKAETK